MSQSKPSNWSYIIKLVLPYWISSARKRAFFMVAFLVAMCGAESYIMYFSSNASSHMMTALSEKHISTFWHEMLALAGSYVLWTIIGVSCYYVRKILELNWREWLTTHFLDKYLANRNYYRISSGNVIDNPDERLAHDVGSFVSSTLSFFDIIVSDTMSLFTYGLILWKIWPPLIGIAIVTAVAANLGALRFGGKLGLKQNHFTLIKNEADFRFELFHLRNNSESVAFYGGESEKRRGILERFSAVIATSKKLFQRETQYQCFTSTYHHLTNWLPYLILAPRFFTGDLKLGDLTQAQGGFGGLLNRLSMVVNFYNWYASYAAVTERLTAFSAHTEAAKETAGAEPQAKVVTIEEGELAVSNLRLVAPGGNKLIVDQLSVNLLPGKGLAISGPPGSGKTSLLRAISGLWNEGSGLIIRPSLSKIMFLPQKPYMPIGTLREQICFPHSKTAYSEAELLSALDKVNLAHLPKQFGGLDAIAKWQDELSPGQQQLIAFARVLLSRPEIVILDEATAALDGAHESLVYELILAMDTSFISIVHKPSTLRYHAEILTFKGDGTWELAKLNHYMSKLRDRARQSQSAAWALSDSAGPYDDESLLQGEDDTIAALRKLLRAKTTSPELAADLHA